MTDAGEPGLLTVRLDASAADVEEPASIAGQIPLAATLARGLRVVVAGTAKRQAGRFRRLLGQESVPVARSVRCSALLVRGFVDIGAGGDDAWGFVPAR